jgi:hypothetical protein
MMDVETTASSEHFLARVDKALNGFVQSSMSNPTRPTKTILKNRQDTQINYSNGIFTNTTTPIFNVLRNKSEYVVPKNDTPFGHFCNITPQVHVNNLSGTIHTTAKIHYFNSEPRTQTLQERL